MKAAAKKIVVTGDMAIDWLYWPVKPKVACGPEENVTPNWAIYEGTRMVAKPGGALLVAEMVRDASGSEVISPRLEQIENIPPSSVVHSIAALGLQPVSSRKEDEKDLRYRVIRFCGCDGPVDGKTVLPRLKGNCRNANLIVFDDAGNGFRDNSALWSSLLDSNPNALVILKMCRPLAHGKLWTRLKDHFQDRLVVVVSADHMRECGVEISRRISWERTAQDFVFQIASNPRFDGLRQCHHLVVRFGIDAAIYHRFQGGEATASLLFDPTQVEDGAVDSCPGGMLGMASAFAGALAAEMLRNGCEGITSGIKKGIVASRRLLCNGYGPSAGLPQYPGPAIFADREDTDPFVAQVTIPDRVSGAGNAGEWSILDSAAHSRLEQTAYHMVTHGDAPGKDNPLLSVPTAQFGNLNVIDRAEIESYQSIRNLMMEYMHNAIPKRPLCVAVFGPPGSGKSFGVTELANSIAPGRIQRIEFNVSQFETPRDLASAFHKVRDIALTGKTPLVFFDEFDCRFGTELGWLKFFLAPMQDGTFKDGDSIHPIGKAILVFAGGVYHTFQKFSPDDSIEKPDKADADKTPQSGNGTDAFKSAKGPDFVSRLRGFVNIVGPNARSEADTVYVIRRAKQLRFNLKERAPHIFDENKICHIDPGVLRAMIKVPEYKHAVRSMLAILDMSMLSGRRSFEQSALPTADQLQLHVDPAMFRRLVLQDVLFGDALEALAKAVHENYRALRLSAAGPKRKEVEAEESMQLWETETLDKSYRESSRQQANSYPFLLQAINCGMEPAVDGAPVKIKLTEPEIETMAVLEHRRFVDERAAASWTCGPRDDVKKKRPSPIEWDRLPKEEKDKDIDAARRMQEVLNNAGFQIYRLP